MAWSEIPSRSSADANASADINQLQDNTDALKGGTPATVPSTDIESLATDKLEITDIDDLPADDADVPVSSQYMYRVANSRFRGSLYAGSQSIGSGAWDVVELDDTSVVGYDPLSKWDGSNYYWEVPYDGIYLIIVNGTLVSLGSDKIFYMAVFVDSGSGAAERVTDFTRNSFGSSKSVADNVCSHLSLSAGDKIYYEVYHDHGSNLSLLHDAKGNVTFMTIQCVAITA